MRDAVAEAAARVLRGRHISRSLAQSRLFPPMTVPNLSKIQRRAGAMLGAALNQEGSDGLIAPSSACWLLIIAMGLFVMGIVFAMLLPILKKFADR
jgi:general secretion pathway protein F